MNEEIFMVLENELKLENVIGISATLTIIIILLMLLPLSKFNLTLISP